MLRRFLKSEQGNFTLMTALILPVVLGIFGAGLDFMMLREKKELIQSTLDSASLAAVSALAAQDKTTSNINAYALNFLSAQLQGRMNSADIATLVASTTVTATQDTSGSKKSYTVAMTGSLRVPLTPFTHFAGASTANLVATSSTTSTVISKALSVYLVVDRSGSMSWVTTTTLTSPSRCQNYTESNWGYYPNLSKSSPCYLNKIGSLKNAAASLFDTLDSLEAQDTSNTILRTGVVSFTDVEQTPSNLAWGTTTARNYVTSLPSYPTGGTDMTGAMSTAYRALTATAEATAQASKNNTSFQKFIILMTDGENTGASATWNPVLDAQTLATCTAARNAGVTIFTVAYMAPSNGISLLQQCAGSTSNAFQAENAQDLTAAFTAIGVKISERATRITG
jgi:Flp pilus assembly protein TadG